MKKKIVIIGAGLAGLSAALQTSENGNKVVLVSAYPSERAQSVMAEGGINAALNTKGEDDSPEQHYADTIHAACGLADENAVWNLTHAAPELVGGCIASAFSLTPAESMSRICAISAVKRRSALLLPRATPASKS